MAQGFIKHKVYIPLENVDMDAIKKYYTINVYAEQACQCCPHLKERHCDICESCQAFEKQIELFSVRRIKGNDYCLLPNGNFPKLQKVTGIDFSNYIDLRCREKFRYPLKWTGKLRQGEIVNDVKSADQNLIVRQWLSSQCRYGFIQAPPRTGKSILGNFIAVKMGFRTLICAHQKELLENFYKSLERDTNLLDLQAETGKPIAKIIEGPKDLKLIDDLDIALVTYQSFIHDQEKVKKYLYGKFGLVIIDEAHQSGAEAYSKFLGSLDARYKLGLSATPLRKDAMNRVLFNLIGPVTVKTDAVGLIPRIEVLETGVKCMKSFSMWVYAMKFLQENDYRNDLIVSEVFNDLKEHKCILIPVESKNHMETLLQKINDKAGDEIAVGYHAGCKNRKTILKEIDAGKYRVVVAIRSMIKQGIDLLSPSMIYIQSPMSAKPQPVGAPFFYQMGNRVATPYPGKREPIIKIFIDDMGESYGCFAGLFMKEIRPGLKSPQDGRPKYSMSPKCKKFCYYIVKSSQGKNKSYFQDSYKSYNPDKDPNPELPSRTVPVKKQKSVSQQRSFSDIFEGF